jgi:hypothetical protein
MFRRSCADEAAAGGLIEAGCGGENLTESPSHDGREPMRHLILGAAVLFIALSASAQATTAEITGVVKDNDGALLPGVTITLSSASLQGERSTVTSNEGRYRFTDLPPGEYRITAEMSGHAVAKRDVELRLASSMTVDFTFGLISETPTITGTIEGTVRSGDTPLEDAAVVIRNASGEYKVKTDAAGSYEQTSITPGPWKITVSRPGYKTKTRQVTLGQNETLIEDFTLQKENAQ